jgi:hypothetical protein
MVIGRAGKDCARARRRPNKAALPVAIQCRSVRRGKLITPYKLLFKVYQDSARLCAGLAPDFVFSKRTDLWFRGDSDLPLVSVV